MEPSAENTIPSPKAFIASPFFAIGYPSNVVAMEDAVPGMFSRIAEISPPEIPPMYTATRVFIPRDGVIEKVNGNISATAIEADSPGIEPNTIPIATPAIINRMDAGCIMLTNAFPKSPNACISFASYKLIEKIPAGRTILNP